MKANFIFLEKSVKKQKQKSKEILTLITLQFSEVEGSGVCVCVCRKQYVTYNKNDCQEWLGRF